jgi:ketosteroid isomerase-like protein
VSQRNLETIRRYVRLANDRDLDALGALCDRDAVLYAPDGWPEPGPWHGREAFVDQLRRLQADFSEHTLVVEEITAHEDWVLTTHVWRTRGERSGIDTEFRNSAAFRLRDGKIVEARYFWDHSDALRAAGLLK